MIDKCFFTIVHPETYEETRLNFTYDDIGGHDGIPAKDVILQFEGGKKVTIDPQQLAELGTLFLALAGTEVDYSSCDTVLDGFNLKGLKAATLLAEALEE